MEFQPQYAFFAVFALFAGFFIYRVITRGGFKGAMFNATIEKTYGTIEQESAASGFMGGRLKIHRLDADGTRKVGIEVLNSSYLSWQMIPVKLSKENTRRLIDALKDAVEDR